MDDVRLRRATASDAQAIGAVFGAAGWTFLGELAQRQMFTARQWDELVGNYAPPNDPDGTTRESGFHGEPLRELRLIKEL